MANELILVVDDEEHILELIRFNLKNAGYKVVTAVNGEDAIKLCNKELPGLMLLDIMLPGIDGLEVCKRIKSSEKTQMLPIIMLTAKSEEIDKILGLELGADDYITKPFSIRELMARVKALLRRSIPTSSGIEKENPLIYVADLSIDANKYEVYKKEKRLELTLKEFELLRTLVMHKGKVLTRDSLLDQIWGYEYVGETRTVDVHIRHLRQKLGEDTGNYIETIRGVGYKFNYKGDGL